MTIKPVDIRRRQNRSGICGQKLCSLLLAVLLFVSGAAPGAWSAPTQAPPPPGPVGQPFPTLPATVKAPVANAPVGKAPAAKSAGAPASMPAAAAPVKTPTKAPAGGARAADIEDLEIPDELPPAAAELGIEAAPGQQFATPRPGETQAPVATAVPGQPTPLGKPVASGATPAATGARPAAVATASPETEPVASIDEPVEEQATGGDFDFMRQAFYAGILVALMCSYLGLYVVLKRIVFVGVALAEVSSAGIAMALMAGFAPMLGAIGFMLLGVLLFSMHWTPRRVPHESYIGVVYSVAAAMSILLIAKSAQGETHMLTLLQGDVLTVNPRETLQMLAVFAVVALIHLLFTKEFILVSFDRESANTIGFSAARWDLLLFLTIGIVIAFSIRSVGVLLTSSMLILPAATALLITNRLRQASIMAPILGVVPVALGLYLSYQPRIDLPASALIVALSFLLLLPALVYSVIKGRA